MGVIEQHPTTHMGLGVGNMQQYPKNGAGMTNVQQHPALGMGAGMGQLSAHGAPGVHNDAMQTYNQNEAGDFGNFASGKPDAFRELLEDLHTKSR